MAKMSKEYELAIRIAGKVDSSFSGAVGSAQGALSKLGDFAGTIAKTSAMAIGAATAAATAFAKSAVDAGKEFDTAMSQVAATMGTTTGQIGALRDFAQQMGATTAFSATQAAEAINNMAMAGYTTEEVYSTLPSVLDLASAGALDLDYSTQLVANGLNVMGLGAESATELTNKLAVTASSAYGSVSDFGEGLLVAGAQASLANVSLTDTMTALGILGDNGISAGEGGTYLRNTLKNLYTPTADAAKALDSLGIRTKESDGSIRDFQVVLGELGTALDGLSEGDCMTMMSRIFDTRTISAANALIENSGDRWDDLSAAISGAWLNMASLTETLSEAGMDLTAMQSNLNRLGIDGNAFSEILSASGGNAEEFAAALLEAANAGVSYQDIVSALGGDLGNLQAAFNNTNGAAAAMAATQYDNLAGDITFFKSALESAQIVLSDQLTPSLREFVQFGSRGLSQLTTAFQEGGLGGAMEAVGDILSDGLNMVVDSIPYFIDAGMRLLGALGQGILDNLPTITAAALTVAIMLVNGLVSAFPALTESGTQLLLQLATGIAEAVPELIPAAVSAVFEIVNTLTSPDTLSALLGAALTIILALGDGLIEALPDLIAAIPIIVRNLVTALVAAAPEIAAAGAHLFGSLVSVLPAIMDLLLTGIQTGIDAVGAFLQEKVPLLGAIFTGWASSISAAIDNVKTVFSGIIDFIGNVFAGNWSAAWQNIQDIFGNLFGAIVNLAKAPMNGVISAINFVLEKINGISVTIPDWVPGVGGKTFGFNLPTIPQMAEGGIVTAPRFLEAGEAGEEAIIPLSELWGNMQSIVANSISGYTEQLAALTEQFEMADTRTMTMPISDLLADLVNGNETPEDDDGGGDNSSTKQDSDGPVYHIHYNPEYHFEGGAPDQDTLTNAERISQEEFVRCMDRYLKDRKRRDFGPVVLM